MPNMDYVATEMVRLYGAEFAQHKDVYEFWYKSHHPKMMLMLLWLIDHRQRFEKNGDYAYFDQFRTFAQWLYEQREALDNSLPAFEEAIEETRFSREMSEGRLNKREHKQAIWFAMHWQVESYLLWVQDEEKPGIANKFRDFIPRPFHP